MSETEFFFELSPERVLQAVEAAGLAPTGHCFALNALENRVYDLRLEDGKHVVAKFYRPGRWSREAILEEHAMLAALERAEIPVCVPQPFPDGGTLHEVESIYYAIWPRTGGRSPDEFRDDEICVLGRLLARIHDVAESQAPTHRPILDADEYGLASLAALEEGDFLPPSCRERFRSAVHEVAEIYRKRSEGVPLQPIHGDCHAGNLLRDGDRWFFLDFDDMRIGPAVQDVWMLLPGRDAEAARQRQVLVDAYREFRPFEDRWFDLVEPLRAFRYVFYAGWIARRFEDPAFPDAFPHFGSEDYWETETRDLEEQLDLISTGGAPADAGDSDSGGRAEDTSEGELTNADFFWDL